MKTGVARCTVKERLQTQSPQWSNAMQSFLSRHEDKIQGSISGFDRLRLTGSLRILSYTTGLANVLSAAGVLIKDFGNYVESLSQKIKKASEVLAQATPAGRVIYLSSGSQSKEDYIRTLPRHGEDNYGLFAVLSCVEPCRSVEVHRNAKTKFLEILPAIRKCLHVYFYMEHPRFGLMHLRLQTWLPMQIKVCINGREWLARELNRAGIGYLKKDNAFTYIEDFARAQAILDQQLRVDWPLVLNELVRQFHPTHSQAFVGAFPQSYYWTTEQCEWATDVLFHSPEVLAEWYPRLVHHGITTFSSRDILRFLQQKVPAQGGVNGNFAGELISDLKQRPEGIRIKHRCVNNSIKLYDKQGQVLRVETTINDASGLKAYRPVASDPNGAKQWQPLRKGVADLHRLCELSQAANERYLDALSAVDSTTPLEELSAPLCRPVVNGNRRYRGLNPLSERDAALLETVQRGEYLITGFRNRDVREIIYGAAPEDEKAHRRQSNRVGRLLALLRAHGLIKKVPRTHRYQVTASGQTKLAAISAARKASIEKLTSAA
jgi:hypothetical protein